MTSTEYFAISRLQVALRHGAVGAVLLVTSLAEPRIPMLKLHCSSLSTFHSGPNRISTFINKPFRIPYLLHFTLAYWKCLLPLLSASETSGRSPLRSFAGASLASRRAPNTGSQRVRNIQTSCPICRRPAPKQGVIPSLG